MSLTDEALEEWRAHPVTEALRDLLLRECRVRRRLMFEDFLALNEPTEADRRVLTRIEEVMGDWFALDAERMTEIEDWINEQERHHAD